MASNPFRKKRRRDKRPNSGRVPPKKQLLPGDYDCPELVSEEDVVRHREDGGQASGKNSNQTPDGTQPAEHSEAVAESIQGYRPFNLPLLMDLLNNFTKQHSQASPACEPPQVAMPPDGEVRLESGSYMQSLKCSKCGFRVGPVLVYKQ